MFYGLHVATYGYLGQVKTLLELAQAAEAAGWDGFFIWDEMYNSPAEPIAEPWVTLGAIAATTRRIRFGPLVTPLPRRRPWTVARHAVTLDALSGGRLTLGVGLGGTNPTFQYPGKPANDKERAVLLDEGLDLLERLWQGQPFSYEGQYYQARSAQFLPGPVQSPRVPIWAGGFWPHKAPFRRAARWDGVFPLAQGVNFLTGMLSPQQLAEIVAYVRAHRADEGPFDVVQLGLTSGKNPEDDAGLVAPYQAAGATWWLENINPDRFPALPAARERVEQGPPRVD